MDIMKKERNEARVPSYNENDSQGTSPSGIVGRGKEILRQRGSFCNGEVCVCEGGGSEVKND